MGKPNLLKNAQMVLSKHSPEILVGMGIAGMVSTTVLAVKATPKAVRLIEEKKREERKDELTALETVKTTWKCYIPTAVSMIFSAGCIIGANSVNARRNAALATAYKLSETALAEYSEKVIETIGEKKEQVVRDKVAEAQIANNPVSKSEIIVTGDGDTLCFEPMSGRYFRSSIDKIKRAENELNRRLYHDMYGCVTLNDFYDELGLDTTEVGDMVGWNTNKKVDIGISSHVADNGQPSIVIDYRIRPEYNFDRF